MSSEAKKRLFFKDKVVVITGSSKGIGKATAKLLCTYGARVIINGRNADTVNATLAELQSAGFEARGAAYDVSTSEGSRKLIEESLGYFGRIDTLVNNAGMSMRGNIDELDPLVFEKMFCVNVMGSVYPLIYALPHIKTSQGSVVFVSSVAGIRGLPGLSAYCSSKMALRAIAESMRLELRDYNVHTGLIYVGYAKNEAGKLYMSSDGSYKPIGERKNIKTLSHEEIALAIMDNIYRRSFIMVLSGLGRLNSLMQRISPQFVEWALYRNMKKIKQMSR